MNATEKAEELLQALHANPARFVEQGRGHELLQTFFAGVSVEHLRQLLRSDEVGIQLVAAFVASELGEKARPLVDDVLPLLRSTNRHT